MSTQGLSAPGSSTYNSPTMTVGDGTWDAQGNTFLLPNLQGLNFNTMRYNGMGNRFAQLPGYLGLIEAHGIIAAIVFLFLVPFAIMFNRFYGRSPWFALRVHIWCQILTVMLTTVLFILAFMAVGSQRALTNPHHGIGVALYVLVLSQFIIGWWIHRREKRRRLPYPPVKAVVHKWLGRATALLGLAQVPLGLTLFGSPSYLFILYSIWVFGLLVAYFILSYIQERNRGRDYDSAYSWASGSGEHQHGRFGNFAKGAAAGIGVSALANRLRHRHDVAAEESRHSGSVVSEEKFSQYGQRPTEGLGRRNILGLGALAGVSYWFGKLLGKRKAKRDREDASEYTESTEDSLVQVEEGRPAVVQTPGPSPAAHHALNGAATHGRTESIMSAESWESGSPSRQRRNHGLRNAAIGLGTFAFARDFFKKRRARKEERRIDELKQQDLEDERVQRANSRKYTGDGYHRPHPGSVASTNLSPLPVAGPSAAGALGAATMSTAHPTAGAHPHPATISGNVADPFATAPLPPPPPPHSVGVGSSGSEMYASSGGRQHHRHHDIGESVAAGAAGAAVGLAAGEALARRREHSANRREHSETRRQSGGTGSMGSPPVSVKLNMHSDGRHVTLRRLTEEEAAAERARQRNNRRRRRAGSASTLSGTDNGYTSGDRWRRTEARERQEQVAINAQQQHAPPGVTYAPSASGVSMPIPPPPPIPSTDPRVPKPGPSSVGSPGTYDGNLTETSTTYDNNRKRRRAERAAAARDKQARSARGEFT